MSETQEPKGCCGVIPYLNVLSVSAWLYCKECGKEAMSALAEDNRAEVIKRWNEGRILRPRKKRPS